MEKSKKVRGKDEEKGDRGKAAEKAVLEYLEKVNEARVNFAFERLPDARAARGRLKRQLSDYIVEYAGGFYPLEVKETKHDRRLAKDKIEQLPRLKKWRLAGARPIVLVYHSELDQWRLPDFGIFMRSPIPPSWDMSDEPLFDSAEDALNVAFGFRA